MTVAVDGNALAGPLYEAFGGDMTTATATCGRCGASAEVAVLVVYASAAGSVARCPACGSVLIVAIVRHGETLVDTRGLASLEPS
jgi:NAD-dependent SIR2 family protein deacetylase